MSASLLQRRLISQRRGRGGREEAAGEGEGSRGGKKELHGGSRANSSRRREVRLDGHQQTEEAGVPSSQIEVLHHHHQLLQGSLDFLEEINGVCFEIHMRHSHCLVTFGASADVLDGGNITF